MTRSPRMRGTTLIEMMIIVAILGIFTIGFVQAISAQHRTVSEIGNREAAVDLASSVLEEVRAAPHAELQRTIDQWLLRDDIARPIDAKLVIEVDELRPGVTQIGVTVNWMSPSGEASALRIVGVRGKYQ